MQKVKKVPQRQCVGCREMKDKKSLLAQFTQYQFRNMQRQM